MMRSYALFLALLLAGLPCSALAGPPLQNEAFSRWHVQDLCYTNATRDHPDRTAASLAARDKAIDDCFKAHGLPPRQHPPSAPAGAAAGASTPQ